MQYSSYKGAILATPQKSSAAVAPLATIGGEPDGRGAIIVEDIGQAPNVPQVQAEGTEVNPAKAEPGRDIFAQHPKADIKSEDMVIPPPVVDDEPKAISSVGATSSSEDPQKHDEKTSETPAAEPSLATSGENTPSSSDDSSSSTVVDSAVPSPEVAKAKAQGPLDAEQAEADEVRQELFPDVPA